jgi:hypothetical protein
MSDPKSRDGDSPTTLRRRLDRWVAELNAFLIVFALGLAIMDGTCFLILQIRNLPPSQFSQAGQQPASPMPTALR